MRYIVLFALVLTLTGCGSATSASPGGGPGSLGWKAVLIFLIPVLALILLAVIVGIFYHPKGGSTPVKKSPFFAVKVPVNPYSLHARLSNAETPVAHLAKEGFTARTSPRTTLCGRTWTREPPPLMVPDVMCRECARLARLTSLEWSPPQRR